MVRPTARLVRGNVIPLVLVLVLSACAQAASTPTAAAPSEASSSEASPSADTGELEQDSVTVAYAGFANNITGFKLPGFGEAHGLNIESLQLRSGADLLTALLDGSTDAAILTYTYMFQAADQEEDVVAFAGNMEGGTRLLVNSNLDLVAGDWDGLKALAEERAAAGDKLVLVSSSPSINHAIGVLTLADHGIDIDTMLEFQDVLDPGLHAQMLQSGDADLGILGEAGATIAVVNGWARTFAYPYDTALGPMNTIWLAKRSWVEENPNTVCALVAAIADVANHFATSRTASVEAVIEFTGLDDAIAREVMSNYTASPLLDPAAAESAARIFFGAGLVQQDHSATARAQVLIDLGC